VVGILLLQKRTGVDTNGGKSASILPKNRNLGKVILLKRRNDSAPGLAIY